MTSWTAVAGTSTGHDVLGRAAGRPATTLTTFRDVPWNGLYYRRLGYRVLRDEEIGAELARAMAHEASLPGIEASLRCAMTKRNP